MPRAGRVVPLVIINLLPAEEADRMVSARSPVGKEVASARRSTTAVRGFLEDDDVRSSGNDRFSQCLLASTESDVVTEQT